MITDSAGRVWIATSAGVAKCDASGCVEDSIGIDPSVNFNSTLVEDSTGRLWTIGNGVSSHDGSRWQNHPVRRQDGSAFSVSAVVAADSGRMWLRSGIWWDQQGRMRGQGVALVENDGWDRARFFTSTNGLTGDCVVDMALDRSGALWCLSVDDAGKAIDPARYGNGAWSRIAVPQGLKGGGRGLYADSRGGMWLLCTNEARYDGNGWTVFDTTLYEGLAGVNPVFEDRNGQIWFGTGTRGLYRYDGQGWTVFNSIVGSVPGRMVTSIGEDANGSVWTGLGCSWTGGGFTQCAGLWQQVNDAWRQVPGSGAIAFQPVCHIMRARSGAMWCASGPGVYGGGTYNIAQFDGAAWHTFTPRDGFSDTRVSSILEASNGDIWFSTYNGLTRLRGADSRIARPRGASFSPATRSRPSIRFRVTMPAPAARVDERHCCVDIKGRAINERAVPGREASGVEIPIP